MNEKVEVARDAARVVALPARVQEALGALVGAGQEGLLALSVGVGLGVLSELLEEEVTGGRPEPPDVSIARSPIQGTCGSSRGPPARR